MSAVEKKIDMRTDKTYFIIAGVIGLLVSVFLIVSIIITFGKILKVDALLHDHSERFSIYQIGRRNYPSGEREDFLHEQRKGLGTILARLREYPFFWERVVRKDLSAVAPLKFKEELFRVKNDLRMRAQKNDVILYDDIGFYQWERELPPHSKLEDLFQALEVSKAIEEVAIDARVNEIEGIIISDVSERQYAIDDGDAVYFEREIRIRLRGTFASLVTFVYNINMSELLLNVRHMKINRLESELKKRKREERETDKDKIEDREAEILAAECTIVNTCL